MGGVSGVWMVIHGIGWLFADHHDFFRFLHDVIQMVVLLFFGAAAFVSYLI